MTKKHYLLLGLVLVLGTVFVSGCGEKKAASNTSTTKIVNENSNKAAQNGNANVSNVNTSVVNASVFGPQEGLVAYWNFDENSGNYTEDLINKYRGNLIGEAAWTTGKFGSAVSFDGSGDYVDLSSATLTGVGNQRQGTVSFWFKYDSQLSTQAIMPIFYMGINDTNKQDNMFVMEIGHGGTESNQQSFDPENKKLYVTWIQNGDEPYLCYDTNTNLAEDTWYHFALVVSEEGNTGYLNGVEMTNRDYNFGQASDQKFFNEIPTKDIFTFGYGKSHDQVSAKFDYFKGALDEVRIYSRALASSEIMELLE